MLCCAPEFRPRLEDFNPAALEHHAGSIMGLWPDNTLAYMNPAWFLFSHENGGEPDVSMRWELGASISSAIGSSLLPFYTIVFAECRRAGRPWEHAYECSSPETFRQFHMRVLPLSRNGELLIINSLHVERPHEPSDVAPDCEESAYRDERNQLRNCVNCRRFRHAVDHDRWDWIPAWIEHAREQVFDALCPICADYYLSGNRQPPRS